MMKRKHKTLISFTNSMVVDLPAPSNITHFWNFGSLLGFCLFLQMVVGIFLAMHYSPSITSAFNCLDHIMRNVDYGWILRLMHANGASLFFMCLFIHIGRGLYFQAYVVEIVWFTGVLIFLIAMLTAFLGYVLPWGQMSYWGATVITNLLSAIPYLGTYLVEWVWGGFSVNNSTLNRFFSLHYLFPFIITIIVFVHLIFLHEQKSSNPLGIQNSPDKIPFHPYFSFKDIMSLITVIFLFMLVNFQLPFILMDPDNFNPANPMVTPSHIQPEWYFLFAYAILRAIPNKLGGVLALVSAILVLAVLPLKKNLLQNNKKSMKNIFYWFFIIFFLLLTWLGMKPVEDPFMNISIFLTIFYFTWYFI